ncbi:menadione-induced gene-4 [Colletotrichum lupini]|uniref:Dehydrogenase FUB6 n=1 Tax=Colletotrichum lupini TaxID=145971 RepID=A0A9Q8SPP4_9PEZI|nr:menadione-induced gene-4 [Colletotrichum lupini]UQC81181.1 menadione-induced gene-4 [Colletotrichum lupini]
MVANKSLIFKKVHETPTVAGQDIAVESRDFDLDQELLGGSILVQVLYVSFDPYMKGRMVEKPVMGPYKLNEPIPNTALAKVLQSKNEGFPQGAIVRGEFPISQYAVATAEDLQAGWAHLIENPLNLPLDTFLAALGMPGLAAYASLYEIGKPKKGETLYVSAAAGAVGHVVGQIAKREGLHVIGSVGADEKVDYLVRELGFDAVFNYKKETVDEGLARLAPDGIDIFYDNVGGETLDAVLLKMNTYGRIIACGAISQYSRVQGPYTGYGVTNIFNITVKRVTMAGYIVTDPNIGPKYGAEHMQNVSKWIHDGSFTSKSTVVDGVDQAADGFVGLFYGKNIGKALLLCFQNAVARSPSNAFATHGLGQVKGPIETRIQKWAVGIARLTSLYGGRDFLDSSSANLKDTQKAPEEMICIIQHAVPNPLPPWHGHQQPDICLADRILSEFAAIGLRLHICRWSDHLTPTTESVTAAHRHVKSIMAEKGPFDGIMGFSQGAAVAVSMILRHQLETPSTPPLFKFAILIGSPLPFSHSLMYGIDTRDYFGVSCNVDCSILARYNRPNKVPTYLITPDRYLKDDDDEDFHRTEEACQQPTAAMFYQMFHSTSDEVRMDIPTVHIFGRRDPWYLHSKDVLELACAERASVLEHCYGHEVPRHLSEEICDLIESAVALSVESRSDP